MWWARYAPSSISDTNSLALRELQKAVQGAANAQRECFRTTRTPGDIMDLHSKAAKLAAAAVLVAVIGACSDIAKRINAPEGPRFHFTDNPQPSVVCKVGPPGTYTFQITGTMTGTLLVSNPFTLQAGECKEVYQGSTTEDYLTVSEIDMPAGTTLDHIFSMRTAADCNTEPEFCETVTGVNGVMIETFDIAPYTITFYNVSSGVCTDETAGNFNEPLPCVYGKAFTIGPSSMEGAIRIGAGDWVSAGYSFKFNSAHIATSFTVSAFATIGGACRDASGQLTGTTDAMTVPMGTKTYVIPASTKATDWLPTGDANNVLSWAGSVPTPSGLCGGGGNKLDASKGAIFHATVSQNPPSGSLVDFRFKYRDPAAKGKPNTNCLDTSDPNRARADVCGASWSQTVTDP